MKENMNRKVGVVISLCMVVIALGIGFIGFDQKMQRLESDWLGVKNQVHQNKLDETDYYVKEQSVINTVIEKRQYLKVGNTVKKLDNMKRILANLVKNIDQYNELQSSTSEVEFIKEYSLEEFEKISLEYSDAINNWDSDKAYEVISRMKKYVDQNQAKRMEQISNTIEKYKKISEDASAENQNILKIGISDAEKSVAKEDYAQAEKDIKEIRKVAKIVQTNQKADAAFEDFIAKRRNSMIKEFSNGWDFAFYTYDESYFIQDINGDGIDELVIQMACRAQWCSGIFEYRNNRVKKCTVLDGDDSGEWKTINRGRPVKDAEDLEEYYIQYTSNQKTPYGCYGLKLQGEVFCTVDDGIVTFSGENSMESYTYYQYRDGAYYAKSCTYTFNHWNDFYEKNNSVYDEVGDEYVEVSAKSYNLITLTRDEENPSVPLVDRENRQIGE